MSEPTIQEILNRLLENLKSEDAVRQLDSLRELGTVNFSSDAIVRQLEKLALGENESVRTAALDALDLKTSQFVVSKRTLLIKNVRQILLDQIESWQEDGLIEPQRAEVLKRKYDFDIKSGKSITAPTSKVEFPAPKAVEPAAPQPVKTTPAPAVERASLTQTLLSETSIKIYLYLGAFFVIIAAAILAALVESARLPTLLMATLTFAGGAVGLRKRLPQPSFALAIVFSFLLPIDANVIADSLALSLRGNHIYWTLVFLFVAIIWTLGTWFYASRLFSFVAFVALLLAAFRFGNIFDASANWAIFSFAVTNLLGSLAIFALKKWKDTKFILPIFLLAQLVQIMLLFISLITTLGEDIVGINANADWIAAALTWILAAAFYAASDSLIPFLLFPWTAAASLSLLPWLVLSAFDATPPAILTGFAIWGSLATFTSEFVRRSERPAWTKYHFPLLSLSLPLFFTAICIGFGESTTLGFTACLGTAIVYTLANFIRPRWYVWMTALLAGVGAYFTFFALPFMEDVNVQFTYQLLGASLLLLIPELFFKQALSFARTWNWPPVALGTLLTSFCLVGALLSPLDDRTQFGNTAIILTVYALLFAGYALRFKQPLIAYGGTISLTLAIIHALQHFDRTWWLPALTALAILYCAAGFLLARREETKPWSPMLVISGLVLGALVSVVSVFTLKETGGWYALVIAALFVLEMFTRKNGYLEIFVESVLSIALILFLNDFQVEEFAFYLFGLSLLWLTCDAVFKLTFTFRKLELPIKIIGALLTLISALFLVTELNGLSATAVCFGVYTLFLAGYAWLHKEPLFGYASTLAFALTVYYTLEAVNFEAWIHPQIAVATLYYAAGFFLRRTGKAKGWDSTLLFSGLGLGTFVALLAPSQMGGLEKALPIAIAATFYAAEAFARKNVWLGFPANGLYLISYFAILSQLNVDEPQFYSVGAAALGLFQHYLLRRANQKTAAFIMGVVSQLVLLGTSYIQMVDTGELTYYFLLLFQFLAMLVYGIVVRSRSLIIAPIAIVVLATLTILYNALKDLSLVIIIGVTGIILLGLGILAVVMRERITNLAERFSDWDA
jgi:hypothetical protein